MEFKIERDPNYLEHHGILGQKWGTQNGPPYPLDYESHSAAEKKKNPKGKLDNYSDAIDITKSKNRSAGSYTASNQKEIDEIWKHSASKDITLPKGSNFYRVGDKNEKFGDTNRKDIYASPSIKDNIDYKDLYSFDDIERVNYVYSSKKDVKIASKDAIARTILEMCNNNETAAKTQEEILNGKLWCQSSKKLTKAMSTPVSDLDKMSDSKYNKTIDTLIKSTTGNIKFGATSKNMDFRIDIERALVKKGYSGMIDFIDIKKTGKGIAEQALQNAPMVLFDSNNFNLNKVESIND